MPHRHTNSSERILVHPDYTLHYRQRCHLNWHSEARSHYMILALLDGSWRFAVSNDKGTMRGGDALLVLPNEPLSLRGDEASFVLFSLSPTLVLDCAVRIGFARSDAFVSFHTNLIGGDAKLIRLARDVAEELATDERGRDVVASALVEQVMVHLLRRYARVRRADELELTRAGLIDRRLRRAVELMYAQLDRELSLEEMAAAAYLSPFHFARLFKKATGTTPHAYLAALRLARAETLLAQTDLSITEIAGRVGYSSPSHFAKAFRRATGLSPRVFRAALIKGNSDG
ncbi:MAG: helix-turn-helix domain-containing protein [Pyrinomonas methylaliphatogenes]|nr:helix-turn-helix domain-containing protein [Pyrinomonas methylaliphatogenes]